MSYLKNISLSAVTLMASASLFAGTDLDSRVRELEKQMKQVRIETSEKTFGANAASARPSLEGQGFALSFDVFYWQMKSGGTEYCVTSRNSSQLNLNNKNGLNNNSFGKILPLNGNLKEQDFSKWDWGFRVGAGYNFEHGDWDVYANYTYFTNDTSSLVTAPSLLAVGLTVLANSPDNSQDTDYSQALSFTKATSQYRFRFNRIDLELGTDFFVNRYLSLRPHVGLMTAWITQKQSMQFTGGGINQNTVSANRDNSYWGIGPRVGFNTKWRSCNGFGIIGNFSAGLPYGRFDIDFQQKFSLDPDTNFIKVNEDMHRFTPTAQMQLGFGYDTALSCDTHHLSMFLAWDIQYWWRVSQNSTQYLLGITDRIGEDVSLQGVTYHIKWDF
jgi:hypothetical protein